MNPEFPAQTADEVGIQPNKRASGEVEIEGKKSIKVWMQTLNSVHRSDAETAANHRAAIAVGTVRKNTALTDSYKYDFSQMEPEQQAEFLANHDADFGRFATKIMEKFPEPLRPERGELSEEKFTALVTSYEDSVQEIALNRAEYFEVLRSEKVKAYLELKPQQRVELMMKAYYEVAFARHYQRWVICEILLRAIRCYSDHGRQFYRTAEQIDDLDDDIKFMLQEKYSGLDSVKLEEIPT